MLRYCRIALLGSSLASPPSSTTTAKAATAAAFARPRASAGTSGGAAASSTSAAAPQVFTSPFADLQSSMHRSYRYDMVVSKLSKGGLILARQENAQTYSFAAFDGVAPLEVARRIMQVPLSHRTFHVVVGRPCVPCDFFGDIDLAASTSEDDFASFVLKAVAIVQTELLAAAARLGSSSRSSTGGSASTSDASSSDALPRVDSVDITTAGSTPEVSLFVSPSTAKRSAHLHISFPQLCLQDYRACRIIAERVNDQLGVTLFDLACCRDKGMLRLGYNCKLPDLGSVGAAMQPLVPYGSTNAISAASSTSACCVALRRTLGRFLSLTPEEQLARTFGLREEHLLLNPTPTTSASPSCEPLRSRNFDECASDDSPTATAQRREDSSDRGTSASKSNMRKGPNGVHHRGASTAVSGAQNGAKASKSNNLGRRPLTAEQPRAAVLPITSLYQGTTVKERRKNAAFDPSSFAGMGRGNEASGATAEVDAQGRPIPAFLRESTKPRRYQEVVVSLRALPSHAAEHYDQWIRVGLALHNFSSGDTQFEEWVLFSLRCPKKFSRDACRKFWDKFHRNPDHANWRRGYNYLTKSIWRDLGIARR